ncbi:YoaK family protein [Sediminibacterium soli]|uniref:YoaK family protein n=1 Tax=Sediminibacterium soli TaxID=2698829 RepID=UPI00137B802C|nr:YoaK family protein [Sediminibacterium soli]NCI45189.1 DUF1275 domain-containing protein [Sediminibacterium soli]
MFRHQGKTRTLYHNLRIASLLSFIAGIVNVVGFFAVQRLTTNVTGHFAYFMDEFVKLNFGQGLVYFLYIVFFFLGSFASNFIIESVSRKSERYMYVVPVVIESALLFITGTLHAGWVSAHPDTIAFGLLFAMGLQNSLVTTISNAHVRTTHLTGLFTDLGIELSQYFFYKTREHRQRLVSSMRLRLTIIAFFFTGGIVGGIAYAGYGLQILAAAAGILLLGLFYDSLKFRVLLLRRKIKKG